MEKTKKKQAKKYIAWICIVVLAAFLAVMPLLASSNEGSDGPEASILSVSAEYQDIDTQLIGGGTLVSEDAIEITIPAAVKLTEYLVSNGDTVAEGDVIATVDRVSVMSAITEVQEALATLKEEIEDEREEEASDTVTALAGGTVKTIYAQKGDSVQDVMLEHGSLAVLSLDGLMAVDVQRGTDLAAGDTVCVTLSDGTEVEGTVESNLDGVLTVTIADDNYTEGDTVKVTTEDGDRIGSGELYIHSRWNATAYSGTVSEIRVSEGNTVSAGRTLMKLEDTGHTALYQQLVNQHREYEALMLELFQMYQSQTLTAPCDGIVSGVDKNGAYLLSDDGAGWTLTLLANAPNGDDETSYTNLVGQITEVGIDGWVVRMNPQSLSITDYTDLSGVPTDTAAMTEKTIYSGSAPVYQLVDGQWQQSSVTAGDIVLFAGDGSGIVWIVKVGYSAIEQEPVAPSEPETPSQPEETTDPSESTEGSDEQQSSNSEKPSGSGQSGSMSQSGGALSGIGGGTAQEETLYSLETITIASVTSQAEMTLEITIDELDISKIYLGQAADVTVDALSGETFPATVTKIASSGTNEGGNSKFTVELTLEKSGDMLPGMNASAYLTLDTAVNVLTVPVAALNEDGTETIVYTSYNAEKGGLGNPVTVTVGVSDGENAQILSGLDEGTVCYYAYYDTLEISNVPEAGGFSFGR